MIRIKSISIEAFRGITNLDFELEGKSLVLRGENGTGKSSLIDALEFFFTGAVAHLEGVKGLSLTNHGCHVNFGPRDVKVNTTFDPGSTILTRTFATVPTPPKPLEDYFRAAQNGAFILRRAQILEFINSQPADRFQAIANIIGLEALDRLELELMRAMDDLSGKVQSNEKEINELLFDITQTTGIVVTDVDGVLPALNKILEKSRLPSINSMSEIGEHMERMLKIVKMGQGKDQTIFLTKIIETIGTGIIPTGFVSQLIEFSSKVDELMQQNVKRQVALVGLIEGGKSIIEQEVLDVCPLCEQAIDRVGLLARLMERIKVLGALSARASMVREMSVPVLSTLESVTDVVKTISPNMAHFEQLSKLKVELDETLVMLQTVSEEATAAKDFVCKIDIERVIRQLEKIDSIGSRILEESGRLLQAVGLTDEERLFLRISLLIDGVRTKSDRLITSKSELETLRINQRLAEKLYFTFSEAKKSRVQAEYANMTAIIEEYYSILHPNEPYKNIELKVVTARRASTELKMDFFGRKSEDPRALASEGHLDSLGLCIFLAFVKRFNSDCSLVLLDDVVTTIDSGHRQNVCKLLLEKFSDKQLLVTTHDGLWYEQLLASQRAYGMDGHFKNMTIVDWSVEAGPRIVDYKPRWEKIQQYIDKGDKTGAGNQGRQYLEWLLRNTCQITEAPVPFKISGKYEMRDLLASAEKRLESLIKEESFRASVLQSFRNLEGTIIMGNLLSHDNPIAENISTNEVRNFCNAILDLHTRLSCPTCGELLGYYRNLRILRCSNTKCSAPFEQKTK